MASKPVTLTAVLARYPSVWMGKTASAEESCGKSAGPVPMEEQHVVGA